MSLCFSQLPEPESAVINIRVTTETIGGCEIDSERASQQETDDKNYTVSV